jgi:hypothetical protein
MATIEMQEVGGGSGLDASPTTTTTNALSSKLSSATTAATDFAKSMYSRVQTTDPIQIVLFILLAIILSFAIWYIIYKVNQKTDEIASTYVITNNDLKPFGASSAFTNLGFDVSTLPLRNFYIKTAVNCCCLGEWKNNYVDIVPLQSAIADGFRCLDFEIYSENDKPVVAASTKSSHYYKETYNSIPFLDAMAAISQIAFTTTKAVNSTDPVFIHLRIKSNNKKIVPEIVSAINGQFGNRLLGPNYNYVFNGNNLGQVPMSELVGKVIIMADISNPLCVDNDLPLYQIINFGSNSPFLHQLQYEMGVKNTPNMDELIDHNKKNMSIVFPDDPFKENVNFNVSKAFGCQFIGIMTQVKDLNFQLYDNAFNDAGSAFILKPPELCFQPVVIETPPPQKPELSFAGRNYQTDYASWSV